MASENSPTSEENINNQTASENIYDIFGTSPDTTEVDEKENWLEKCHGCLRLFFSTFLFIFVFGTALLSRLTFHIILINLNPPTIFTTMVMLETQQRRFCQPKYIYIGFGHASSF